MSCKTTLFALLCATLFATAALWPRVPAVTLTGAAGGCVRAAEHGSETLANPFPSASLCATCHSEAPGATAMRTATGHDASPHGLWEGTMMAHAFRDPAFRAQLALEREANPGAEAALEGLCLRCHAPAPHHEALLAGDGPLTMESADAHPLAAEGVSCAVCHRIRPEGLGEEQTWDGQARIDDDDRLYGPYEDPFLMPMRRFTGFTATEGAHVRESALCATCHTVRTEPLAAPGSEAKPEAGAHGEEQLFHEQSPYLEWRNSIYATERGGGRSGKSCQSCHMPELGQQRIARSPRGGDFGLPGRQDVRGHAFLGGNAFMLDLMAERSEELGIDDAEPLRRGARANRAFLRRETASLTIEKLERRGDTLHFHAKVVNLSGHKLPTGYPARRLVLRSVVRSGRQVLFASGNIDAQGRLADVPAEAARSLPHVQVVSEAKDLVVYERIAVDAKGQATTLLSRMVRSGKDTRLLPKGWKASGPHADITAPVGLDGDPDFRGGGDRVQYEIPLGGLSTEAPLRVELYLHYQALPPEWIDPLRAAEHAEARRFVAWYDATGVPKTETLARAEAELPGQ